MKSTAMKKNGTLLLENVQTADSFFTRFKGLMFRKELPENSGLHITPCNQIHMFNMRFPLDIVYLDKAFRVVHIDYNVQPGKICKTVRQAHSVVEINSGKAEKLGIGNGDILDFIVN